MSVYKNKLLLTLAFLGCNYAALAQKKDLKDYQKPDTVRIELKESSKPTIELNPGATGKKEDKKKEKKRKKKVFYGMKTKRRFIKTISRRRVIIEDFYVLKQFKEPNKYAADKYYFNKSERQIYRSGKITTEYGMPLHGTYVKTIDGDTVVSGIYYVGTMHGRWEKYGSGGILVDKQKYYRGFAKNADISYWDGDMEQIKEIKPYQNGRVEGDYLRYYQSGRVAEEGKYEEGQKVGIWTEYYDKDIRRNGGRKVQVQYPNDPFDEAAPKVLREFDEDGFQKGVKRAGNARGKQN